MSPFPFLNTPAFWWLTLAMTMLFAIAVGIVMFRRRQEMQRRLAIAWTRVNEMLTERGVTPEERTRFTTMVNRLRPHDPLAVATQRHHFDLCLDAEMAWLGDHLPPDQLMRAGAELRDVRVALGLDYIPFGQRIESTRELHAGQEVWLAEAGEVSPQWCRAQITVVDEARIVAIALPDSGEARIPFRKGATLHCRLWREDDARYLFDLVVQEVENQPLRWNFLHTRQLQRIQDRANYRVRVDHSTDIDVLNAPRDDQYDDIDAAAVVTTIHGRITNLSAGGAAIITHQALPKQILLRFPLVLPEAGRLVLVAKPVDIAPQSAGRFLVRVYFVALDDDARDGIARYVLHRQQRLAAPASGEKVTLQ